MAWMHRGAAERVQLIDREPTAEAEPAALMLRIAAEALILQDEAESVLAGINSRRPFLTRLMAASVSPVSGGLRSSSAALMASRAAVMRSSPGDAS